MKWQELLWSCIAVPCTAPREKGSGFCPPHKLVHEASTYPALLKELCDERANRKKK